MKLLIGVVVLLLIAGGIFVWWTPEVMSPTTDIKTEGQKTDVESDQTKKTVVTDGAYTVVPAESKFTWAGKKPLIEGYINQGSIAISGGNIDVSGDKADGFFTIDMNTLSVSNTPTKPGMESTLEGHLKSNMWFDTATYPTATFAITKVSPRPDSDTTFTYDVTGELTMKGQTHKLTFPAVIYQDAKAKVHAQANFEFDRTKWGITAGSGSFFGNLADNAISDMVAVTFDIVAQRQAE